MNKYLSSIALTAVVVLAMLPSKADAVLEIIPAELALHAYTGTIYSHAWWGLAIALTVWYGGSVLFVHRADPVQEQIYMHREHMWCNWVGLIVALFNIVIFRWPRLVDMAFAHTRDCDITPENCRDQVLENEKCVAKGGCPPNKGAPPTRVITTHTLWYWPSFLFTFWALVAAAGGYLLSGRGEPDFDATTSRNLGITFLVLGVLGLIWAGTLLWYTRHPWRVLHFSGRWTLKYLIPLIFFVVPPAFYDYSSLNFYARAAVMAAIYLALDILLYYYMTRAGFFLGFDPYFSKCYVACEPCLRTSRHRDAFWWVTIDWLTRIILYFAMAIANDQFPKDVTAAFVSQVIAGVVIVIMYIAIRACVYKGYRAVSPYSNKTP